jgi:CheY-like chemotaxis protein
MGRQILSQEGHDVVTVSNGDEALQYLAENRPDLIMADTRMPGPNGYEVCREVKHSGRFPDVKVVLLAGPLEPFDPHMAEDVGSDAVLHKPLDAYSLIETINKLLGVSAGDIPQPPEPDVMVDSAEAEEAPPVSEELPVVAEPPRPASNEGTLERLVAGDPFEDLVEQALGSLEPSQHREAKVRGAVLEVLEASLPTLVDTITQRVLERLNGRH